MARWLYLSFITPVLLALALLNLRAHSRGSPAAVISQLQFIGQELQHGGGERMQQLFPEGYVFTWALYGLAAAQLAQQLPAADLRRAELLERASTAVQHVDSPLARSTFSADLNPRYGAFYSAWFLYLRAVYIRAAGAGRLTPQFLKTFEQDCAAFVAALDRSPTPFLPTYNGAAWPADASVGIAALAIHDQIRPARFRPAITRWLRACHRRLDPALRALPHAADATTGMPLAGARGSSLALMSRVLAEAAPDFASFQYSQLRQHFAAIRWGVPGLREYPRGQEGEADVDSGPLFLGYSGPAIVVGAAAARAHDDEAMASTLLSVVEVAGSPVEWPGGRRYAGGSLLIGDAFIAWAGSTPPATRPTQWQPVIPPGWTLPWHAGSLAIAFLLIWPVYRRRRSTAGHSGAHR